MIRQFLSEVKRRLLHAALLQGFTALAWTTLALALAVPLAAHFSDSPKLLLGLGAVGWLATAGAALVPIAWRLRRQSSQLPQLARFVEQRVPGLHNALITSIELGGSGDGQALESNTSARAGLDFSAELVAAVQDSAYRQIRHLSASSLVDYRAAVAHGKALAAVASCALAIGVFFPNLLPEGWSRLTAPPPEPIAVAPATLQVVEVAARDIRVRYVPPAYTRMPERDVSGTGGDLSGLPGTLVQIKARPIQQARAAWLEMGDREEPTLVPLAINADGELQGSLTLDTSGIYRFRLEGEGELLIRERTSHGIDVTPDEPPDVALLLPEADLEVHAQDTVRLAYRARDDYGLDRVDLVVAKRGPGGEPIRKRAATLQGDKQGQGEIDLAVGKLGGEPGDVFEVWFEAADQDGVRGPNIGRSESRMLKIWSPREKHEAIVDQLAALAEAMLDLLGDRLESPVDTRDLARYDDILAASGNANAGTLRIVEAFGEILLAIQEDPLMPEEVQTDLAAIRARHDELQRAEHHTLERISAAIVLPERRGEQLALVASHGEEHITALEDDIKRIEDIVKRLRADLMKDKMGDLASAQEDLMKLLEQLQNSGDPQDMAQAMQQIDELQRQLEQMMQDLAKQAKQMPMENMNLSALDPEGALQDTMDLKKKLDSIKEKLAKGDIEGAMKEAAELQKQLAEMRAMMEENNEGFGGRGMSPEQREKMQKLDQKLGDLADKQQKIYDETSEIEESVRKAMMEQMKAQLQEMLDKQRERAEQLREKIEQAQNEALDEKSKEELDSLRERAKELKEMLERTKLEAAKREAEETAGQCDKLGSSLGESSNKSGNPQQAKQLDQASDRMKEAKQLAEQIAEDLKNAMPSPSEMMSEADRQRMRELRQRQAQNREQLEEMQGEMGQMGGELPGVPQMLQESLDEAQKQMGQAEGELEGERPGQAQGHEQAALERLGQARNRIQQMMQQQRRTGGSGSGLSTEDTVIPQAKDYQVPEEFRSEIMKAAKEVAPRQFAPLIERYYKELVQ